MKKTGYLAMTVITLLLVSTVTGHAGGYYGGRGGWGGGPAFRGSVWIGPGWGAWGPGWGAWGPPVYLFNTNPQVFIQQQPQIFVEPQQTQPEEQGYWYYCTNPQGYSPYVKKCPTGWLKVVPAPPQSDPKE
jgi:hypothetical protein